MVTKTLIAAALAALVLVIYDPMITHLWLSGVDWLYEWWMMPYSGGGGGGGW